VTSYLVFGSSVGALDDLYLGISALGCERCRREYVYCERSSFARDMDRRAPDN
jgi:hypothetical protein